MKARMPVTALLLLLSGSLWAQQPTFEETRQAFRSKTSEALGPDAAGAWGGAAVFVSRETVSRFANTVIEGAHLTLRAGLPQRVVDVPPSEVRTPKIGERNCSRDRWGCNSDCGLNPACAIEKGLCEANKATQAGLCEAQKVAEQGISDKKIFTISTHAVNVAADAGARIHASLDPSLSQVSLSLTDLAGTFHLLGGSVTFQPELLVGVLAACAPFTVALPGTDLTIDQPTATATATLDLRQQDGGFELKVNVNTPQIAFRFNKNPILNVIGRNLHALILCPVATGLAYSAGAAYDLVWNDMVSLPAGSSAFSIPLGDLRIPVPGVTDSLIPVLGLRSIGWEEPIRSAEVRP